MSSVEQNSKLREVIKEKTCINKKGMGWDRVHYELEEAPYCLKRSKIKKVLFYTQNRFCRMNYMCAECYEKEGEMHFTIHDYDFEHFEDFKKGGGFRHNEKK